MDKKVLEITCCCGARFVAYESVPDKREARIRWQDDHRDCMKQRSVITK